MTIFSGPRSSLSTKASDSTGLSSTRAASRSRSLLLVSLLCRRGQPFLASTMPMIPGFCLTCTMASRPIQSLDHRSGMAPHPTPAQFLPRCQAQPRSRPRSFQPRLRPAQPRPPCHLLLPLRAQCPQLAASSANGCNAAASITWAQRPAPLASPARNGTLTMHSVSHLQFFDSPHLSGSRSSCMTAAHSPKMDHVSSRLGFKQIYAVKGQDHVRPPDTPPATRKVPAPVHDPSSSVES